MRRPAIVIHGGAWDIPENEMEAHLNGLEQAIRAGWDILHHGGGALDAVEAAVVILEDDPTFDAGKGSILNTDGSIEMDASIVDGRNLDAGGVAVLRNFPNPVKVARRVLEATDHILLAGKGAEQFALMQGFKPVSIKYLLTPRELKRLESLVKDDTFQAPYAFGKKRGTVGAVALDSEGNIAAATSTGGTPKKIPGRVGDTPLLGCGTYAENGCAGVSCTGWGEAIMKVMLAREVAESVRQGCDAQLAAERSISILGKRADGLGGVICIDHEGNIGIDYNTPHMARAYMTVEMAVPFVQVK